MRCLSRKQQSWRTEWFESAAALAPDWDQGLSAGAFLSRQNLQAQEQLGLPNVSYAYALLRQGNTILGLACFQLLDIRPEHLKQEALPAWQRIAWRLFLRLMRPRLLVGGQLFRHDVQSLWCHPALSPFERFSWYRDLLETLQKKPGVWATLLKELPEDLIPYFPHQSPDYLLLRNDISMQMRIPESWRSIQDYAHSLKHKYALRFRKVQEAGQELSLREMQVEEVEAQAERLDALYRQVAENQTVRLGFLSHEFLPRLKRQEGDALRIWGFWEGAQLVAFASGWVQERSFDMFYIGLDYARNPARQLYFNILFFAVEQAILLRKPLLILGRTALEAKARVGCQPQYLHTFLHMGNPLLRRIVRRMQQQFAAQDGAWEQRHPFASPKKGNVDKNGW